MKIALCQINTTIGNFSGNISKIIEALKSAAEKKADIAVFPELTLSSYPPLDLLDRPEFLNSNEEALNNLLNDVNSIPNLPDIFIIGSITKNYAERGRALFNTALVIAKNADKYSVVHSQSKRLLPTYDVFDETRYFEPATETKVWNSPLGKIGISICEDAWFDDRPGGRQLYEVDPALELKGCDLVVNISASPFEINKRKRRQAMLSQFAKKVHTSVVYVNQVGANDEILFDGGSQILDSDGKIIFESNSFEEKIDIVDLKENPSKVSVNKSDSELIYLGIVRGIKDYFQKTGFKKAVLGLSGGIDSAVIACLAADALGKENVICIAMPGPHSSSHSLSDADALARNLGVIFKVHSIKFINSTLLMEIKPSFESRPVDVTEENLQSRLRGIILLAIANKHGALVLTTGNKSELATGYCTTYGDMAGAIAPIGDLYKTKVFELADFINQKYKNRIPENIIKKPPSAELKPNQKDEDSLGEYKKLDRLLELYLEEYATENDLIKAGFDIIYVQKILKLMSISEFKRRQAAPSFKLTSKAFGLGRRIPIAKK